jgi:(S)-3,5-dihydroxyphenylglycine transaminase
VGLSPAHRRSTPCIGITGSARLLDIEVVPVPEGENGPDPRAVAAVRHFPERRRADLGLRWNSPEGGFFTVLSVPFTADETALERSAREHGVLWTPMDAFYLNGGGRYQLRISSSYLAPEQIADGIDRLAAFIVSEASRRCAAGQP